MITGFNTDIEHDGVIYHVQTEDKGLSSPLILSLVYSGGAILASKRSPYKDLIAAGFDEEKLVRRLKKQHRLICAAITAGRIEELKGMGPSRKTERPAASTVRDTQELDNPMIVESSSERPQMPATIVESSSERPQMAAPDASFADLLSEEETRPRAADSSRSEESAYTVYDPRRKAPVGAAAESQTGLVLTIIDEREFYAGESFAIRILLQNRSSKKEKPVSGVTLSLKILGTTFRPLLFAVKTGRDGIGVVAGRIPYFHSGRAAIVIHAVADGDTAELRRVIRPPA